MGTPSYEGKQVYIGLDVHRVGKRERFPFLLPSEKGSVPIIHHSHGRYRELALRALCHNIAINA